MFKKHVAKVLVAVALLVAVTGSNVVGNAFGFEVVPAADACVSQGGSSGGNC